MVPPHPLPVATLTPEPLTPTPRESNFSFWFHPITQEMVTVPQRRASTMEIVRPLSPEEQGRLYAQCALTAYVTFAKTYGWSEDETYTFAERYIPKAFTNTEVSRG